MADVVASFTGGHAVPEVQYLTVGKSQTIMRGDWIIRDTEATTGIEVAVKLTSAEIAADYTVSGSVAGILGIAMFDVTTDANGVASAQQAPTNVAFGAYPILPIPNVAASLPGDTANSSRPVLGVIVANDWTEFLSKIQGSSNAAVTVDPDLLGDPVGLQVYDTTDFAANTAATGAGLCAIVSRLALMDPAYNASSDQCHAWIKIKPAYQQALTGIQY